MCGKYNIFNFKPFWHVAVDASYSLPMSCFGPFHKRNFWKRSPVFQASTVLRTVHLTLLQKFRFFRFEESAANMRTWVLSEPDASFVYFNVISNEQRSCNHYDIFIESWSLFCLNEGETQVEFHAGSLPIFTSAARYQTNHPKFWSVFKTNVDPNNMPKPSRYFGDGFVWYVIRV